MLAFLIENYLKVYLLLNDVKPTKQLVQSSIKIIPGQDRPYIDAAPYGDERQLSYLLNELVKAVGEAGSVAVAKTELIHDPQRGIEQDHVSSMSLTHCHQKCPRQFIGLAFNCFHLSRVDPGSLLRHHHHGLMRCASFDFVGGNQAFAAIANLPCENAIADIHPEGLSRNAGPPMHSKRPYVKRISMTNEKLQSKGNLMRSCAGFGRVARFWMKSKMTSTFLLS